MAIAREIGDRRGEANSLANLGSAYHSLGEYRPAIKWYYGPRADRLNSTSELAQVLLAFGQELEQRPIHPDDVPAASEPEYELRRVADCHENVTLIRANGGKA